MIWTRCDSRTSATRSAGFRSACAALVLCSTFGHAADAQPVVSTQPAAAPELTLTHLEVGVPAGPDEMAWGNSWRDSAPGRLEFRWTTRYEAVGSAQWQVSTRPFVGEHPHLLATGDLEPLPTAGEPRYFRIDFGAIVGARQHRPLQYYVRVVTFAGAPEPRFRKRPSRGMVQRGTVPTTRPSAGDEPSIKQQVGVPSAPVTVTVIDRGQVDTHFLVHPDLLVRMPISIDLETFELYGEGGDEEPYLMVVVVYADGTTVTPVVDLAAESLTFSDSRVRVASATSTHGNLPGDLDPGDSVAIPGSTGHFEAALRPVGLALADRYGLGLEDRRLLREKTMIGLLVIGMEEDAIPSDEVVDSLQVELRAGLRQKLDEFVQGLSIPAQDPTALPSLTEAVAEIEADLTARLTGSAERKTLDEIGSNLGIVLAAPFGGLNADDFIGYGTAVVSYEQIRAAAEEGNQGVAIRLRLDQNSDETLDYRISGRVRARVE